MKILVTGGAGYIGSHVVLDLLEADHDVIILDDLSLGVELNIHSDAQFIFGSTLDNEALKVCFRDQVDAVIHLAAFKAAGESMTDPEKYSKNNISGTINLLNAMTDHGVHTFVFSSSAAVYGYPEYLPIDEDHPTDPINYYGFTKLVIESFLEWYGKLRGLKYVSLRYFNAAGYDPKGRILGLEQNPANLLPIVMEVASGERDKMEVFGDDYDTPDGTGVRDYIHVSDLASAHVKALDYLQSGDSIIVNLATGEGYSVLDVIEKAREITGHSIPYEITARREGDPAKLIASSESAGELLDWEPKLSDLESLLKTTWRVYSAKKEIN
ncbi:MAG: UDP-glucose 4-epimerase GalE [Candidatus Neomarinimicrobiota bacterium]|nr:MAG: UDP-glucose 4-epimerase GalE [Candidatus Neomarinimicrobiota bacterium]